MAQVTWTYSDPNSSPQNSYQIQIDDSSGFGSPVVDTGQVTTTSTAFVTGPSDLSLGTTYYLRIRAWNEFGQVSSWFNPNVCNGPGCNLLSSPISWTTPQYPYPQASFTFSPPRPAKNVNVQFTDTTNFFGSPVAGRLWSWDFGDGDTSTVQNPIKSYSDYGIFTINMTATNSEGNSCSAASQIIDVQKLIPLWKEILPR